MSLSLVAVAATVAVVAAPAEGKFTGLKGEVGPGFEIKVIKGGARVRTIRAGTYRMQIEDQASIHNFRLRGPGINRATAIPFRGNQMWTVRLRPGI
jgi:hypothetical protein